MKIVIDIPEYIIENVKETKCLSIFYTETLAKAIANGTPLPKGHGRLIDADELLDKVKDYGEGQRRMYLIDPCYVKKAPTIIEADTELGGTKNE